MPSHDKIKRPSIIVVQHGARHNYAMPLAFERAGFLERFYTDLCSQRGIGYVADFLSKTPFASPSIQRLANRRLPPEILKKTHTFDTIGLKIHKSLSSHDVDTVKKRSDLFDTIGKKMKKRGYGETTHILSAFGQGRSFLTEGRKRGIKIICDVNVALSSERIVREEQARFPDWEAPKYYYGESLKNQETGFNPTKVLLEDTDCFLCPSEFVQNDLVENFNIRREKTILLPYAVSPNWFGIKANTIPKRILFGGSAELRKGIHYLAKAAEIVKGIHPDSDIRIAGETSIALRSRPETKHLNFLGRIPRRLMEEEFSKADILVLPSLAEGSAGVTYEAMGCGVPVVTTASAGSQIRNGLDGLIVEERNVEALAEAITRIIGNRALRNTLSENARDHAKNFTWEKFSDRLVKAVIQV